MRLEVWPVSSCFLCAPRFLPLCSLLPLPLNEMVRVISNRTCPRNYPCPQAVLVLTLCRAQLDKIWRAAFRVRSFPVSPDELPCGAAVGRDLRSDLMMLSYISISLTASQVFTYTVWPISAAALHPIGQISGGWIFALAYRISTNHRQADDGKWSIGCWWHRGSASFWHAPLCLS